MCLRQWIPAYAGMTKKGQVVFNSRLLHYNIVLD